MLKLRITFKTICLFFVLKDLTQIQQQQFTLLLLLFS